MKLNTKTHVFLNILFVDVCDKSASFAALQTFGLVWSDHCVVKVTLKLDAFYHIHNGSIGQIWDRRSKEPIL